MGKENVFPKVEFLGSQCVAMLSPLHVLVDLGNRQIEIEVQTQDSPREENDEDRKGGVLEIRHLNFHRSEFYSPTDRRTDRWRFEPNGLPIRRLYILRDGSSAPESLSTDTVPTSKWSILPSSSWSFSSEKMTMGSRMNKCEMCLARRWSIPEEHPSYKRLRRDTRLSYHDPEDVCRSPGRWVPQCRCTPAGSTSYRRYTTRQSRTGIWGYGICCSSEANSKVMTMMHH